MNNWNPIVAYKAGQCVAYDTIHVVKQLQSIISTLAYPNPFRSKLTIELEIKDETYASMHILNYYGELVKEVFKGDVEKGATYTFDVDTSAWPEGFYYYKLNMGGRVTVERILLSR